MGLCPGGVSVWWVSVQGVSLSGGSLSRGVSVWGVSVQGVSLSGGSLTRGVSFGGGGWWVLSGRLPLYDKE